MSIIKAVNLNKSFTMGEVQVDVINNISLEINEGEFVAIMGPSGSGKSTLLYLLGALDNPTGGKVFIDGKDLSIMKDKDISRLRRREMGFIFQFYNLVPVLNVRENILMPIMLDHKKEKDYEEQLQQLIKIVGLEERQYHKPAQLSGGQQQRVAVARALINDPKVILADEPTGNLDTKTSDELLTLMKKLCTENKKTIIMVTHNPEAAMFANRVINIVDGKISTNS